jgi:hypothetical protein
VIEDMLQTIKIQIVWVEIFQTVRQNLRFFNNKNSLWDLKMIKKVLDISLILCLN